ncbi:D-Ala-D-Ala carboxypeptidase [Longispora fulva]|uniref:D-alanyl-D-alanine carboxypeptidase n=1 Tax=Longispora fulva TaxID=619741 RepID=A0A8J7GB05_9ACTN|nr:serine hydrolase domain-containing protein [Longispora fulva]MBG6137073.1 D-alanyl-D-alanine carboxypeptidase [Longispora fulva]GIG61573.1 D-Ala-D-Ala carboxypeptidase [Longispora fulva]
MRRLGATGATLLLALLAGACGSGEGTPPAPAYAADLTRTLGTLITDLRIPGAVVMITSKAKGNWTATFGNRALGGTDRVTVDDHFRVGSNTKTMTGTVILQLVQEGKLGLDDPVSKYRPGVPNGDAITITQLLDMRSGLYNYSEEDQFNVRLDSEPGHAWQPDELLAIAFAQPPYFPPGGGFHYSNTNTVLLGLIIEKLTGGTLQEAFRHRIFDPLGMRNTSLPALADADIPAPHPRGYMFGTNVSTLKEAALPAAEQAAAARGSLLPNDVTDANPSWTWAAGGAISTAGDLTRYVTAMIDGGLLDAKLQKTRLDSIQPVDPTNPNGAGYGMALARFGPLVGHDGQLPGFQSFMAHDPDREDTVIVLTSLYAAPNGTQPANALAMAIIKALYA